MAPDVADADLAVRDRVPQFTRHVQARERTKLHSVAEEANVRGRCTTRFRGRRARVIEQQARGRGIEPQNPDAGINREAKLSVAKGYRLAQPIADLRNAGLD